MVKLYKIHKFAGISAGVILLVLAFTGFFLDHKNWSFLYNISMKHVPDSVLSHEKRLMEAYLIDPQDPNHIFVGSRRGIFEKKDGAFTKTLDQQCLALRSHNDKVYAATDNGVYVFESDNWQPFALQGEFINALAIADKQLLVSIDKRWLTLIDEPSGKVLTQTEVRLPKEALQHDISLGRFVRDLHYGRGLFDGISSLLLNDYAALILTVLAISGYLVWFLIRQKKRADISRRLVRLHANIFSIVAIFPLLILLITGIFLDHPKGLASIMRSVQIPHAVLPPVYSTLSEDIWSVDIGSDSYRIGNRYGIFESRDMAHWEMVSKGFAYRMKRVENELYVSGMGAPNRVLSNDKWQILPKSPHMFKDINLVNEQQLFLAHNTALELPEMEDVTLYSLLLSLHDGTFFSAWWVWINDIAAVLLFVLAVTGTLRYLKRKRIY